MSEHPTQDQLVDLALDDLPTEDRRLLQQHIAQCPQCRDVFDDTARAIDHTLLAAPRIEPGAGFDHRVLAAMGMAGEDAGPAGSTGPAGSAREAVSRWRVPRWQLAAASVVLGLGVGTLGSTVVTGGEEPPGSGGEAGVYAVRHTPLRTEDGRTIGSVSPSFLGDEPVLVVDVARGPAGRWYTCRMLLAGGEAIEVGRWQLRSNRGGSWTVRLPGRDVQSVELVTDTGEVWSSARL